MWIRILCIESAKTVNEMTLNELLKLTTLWTTGPRSPDFISHQLDCNNCCKRMWDRNVFPQAPYSPDLVYSDYYPGANSEWIQVFGSTFDPNFHFHGQFWIHWIHFEYCIYPKYSHPLLFTLYLSSTSPFYYLWMHHENMPIYFDPLKPHFYVQCSKPGFYRCIHYFSYFCSKILIYGYSL